MQRRQLGQMSQGSLLDNKARDSMRRPLTGQILVGRIRQGQLVQRVLDGCFPNRRNTEPHLIPRILNRATEGGRQTRVGADVPEEDMSVEEQPHEPSKSRRTSSGRGLSKSSG